MSEKTWMQEEKRKIEMKRKGISEETCTQGERQKWMKRKINKMDEKWEKKEVLTLS